MRFTIAALCMALCAGPALAQAPDTSPHRVHRVTVEKGVTLEVLDWGGTGAPLVFIPGNGNDAHVFDTLALNFTARHRVYAITRRGTGKSSVPAPTPENYDSDRRGDDVLAVLTALKIEKPVLAGHSLGGTELSSIGTRHPGRVAGLIYLDAGGSWTFYDSNLPLNGMQDANHLRRLLVRFNSPKTSAELLVLTREIRATMKRLEKQLPHYEAYAAQFPKDAPPPMPPDVRRQMEAILLGTRGYTGVKPPMLAIFATRPPCDAKCDAGQRWHERFSAAQIASLQKQYPGARVLRIPGADHRVWRRHEAQVVGAMNGFMDKLGK